MGEFEQIKKNIDLANYAAEFGYTERDRNKSTSCCAVLRRRHDNGKIGISRDGAGHWLCYDFRRIKGGSILDFVMWEKGCDLGEAKDELTYRLNGMLNFLSPTALDLSLSHTASGPRRAAREYGDTWEIKGHHLYLESRGITGAVIRSCRFQGMVRADRKRNACFPYFNLAGVAGIERKNVKFKGYTKGGHKGLWHSNVWKSDQKIMVFESPLDALSLSCLYPESIKNTRYFATGGQVGKHQWPLLDRMITQAIGRKMQIVLAFDNDQGGANLVMAFQSRYPKIAFGLELPPEQGRDWNDMLAATKQD